MSVCISSHGEYSRHEPGEGSERFVCRLCHVFDETAALAELDRLTAIVRALGDGTVIHVEPDDVLLIGNVDGRAEDLSDAFDHLRRLWPERRLVVFSGDIDVQKISPAELR